MGAYVPVQVPEEYVMEVYAFLSSLKAKKGPGAAPQAPKPTDAEVSGATGVATVGHWPVHLLQRAVSESPPEMRETLVLLAKAGDAGMSTTEIADHFKMEKRENAVAGMFGAFGRRCHSRYGVVADLWDRTYPQHADGTSETRVILKHDFRDVVLDAAG